jgi:hypothetical protein
MSEAVVVISPFRATMSRSREDNKEHAKILCRRLARAGCIVYAGHLMCPEFLDEDLPSDREIGLAVNLGWIERSDRLAVWDVWGISSGMDTEIKHAEKVNLTRVGPEDDDPEYVAPIKIHYFSKGEVPEWEDLHSRR